MWDVPCVSREPCLFETTFLFPIVWQHRVRLSQVSFRYTRTEGIIFRRFWKSACREEAQIRSRAGQVSVDLGMTLPSFTLTLCYSTITAKKRKVVKKVVSVLCLRRCLHVAHWMVHIQPTVLPQFQAKELANVQATSQLFKGYTFGMYYNPAPASLN